MFVASALLVLFSGFFIVMALAPMVIEHLEVDAKSAQCVAPAVPVIIGTSRAGGNRQMHRAA